MNLLAELLPDGLLQRTDRQALVITVFIPPLSSGAACLHITGRPQLLSNPYVWTLCLHFEQFQYWPFPSARALK